jgi:hypothetical protein
VVWAPQHQQVVALCAWSGVVWADMVASNGERYPAMRMMTDRGWVQITLDAGRAGSALLNFAVDGGRLGPACRPASPREFTRERLRRRTRVYNYPRSRRERDHLHRELPRSVVKASSRQDQAGKEDMRDSIVTDNITVDGVTDDTTGITDYLNDVSKHVVSSTMQDPEWERTTVLRSVDDIRVLKSDMGGDIVTTGSMQLVRELIADGSSTSTGCSPIQPCWAKAESGPIAGRWEGRQDEYVRLLP